MNKVAAIVVTYHPDEFLLRRLLVGLEQAGTAIIIVDNTPIDPGNWLTIQWIQNISNSAHYIPLYENLGIAKAQNVGIEFADHSSCDYAIFFDQDSAFTNNLIVKLLNAERELLSAGKKVAAVGPLFLDEKTNEYSAAIRHKGPFVYKFAVNPQDDTPVYADYLISSGSLIRLSVLREVGLMLEELFIDWVDIEWGLRAKNYGYQSFIVPQAVLLHSIGDRFVSINGKNINIHSDIRNYYIIRNACYLLMDASIIWQWKLSIFFKIPQYVLFYTLTSLSGNKIKTFRTLVRACIDGFNGRLGPFGG